MSVVRRCPYPSGMMARTASRHRCCGTVTVPAGQM
jgi:hypothetical protein